MGEHPLADHRVLVVGLEPWGMVAALELALAGVGTLLVMDDGSTGPDEVAAVPWLDEAALGVPRREAVASAVDRLAAACTFRSEGLDASCGEERWDLVLAAVPADDLLSLDRVSRSALAAGAPLLVAHVDGLHAILGPLVVPRHAACWSCFRLRGLAHTESPEVERAVHAQWLTRHPPPRLRTYLPSMLAMLGHVLALAAIDALAGSRELCGRMRVQNLVTLETTFHAALPVPHCPVCGGAGTIGTDRRPRALDSSMSPVELRDALAGVVDARVGIVRALSVGATTSALDPELPITATAVLGDAGHPHRAHGDGARALPEVGSGKGLTATQAMIGAVGEAIERYSAARVDVTRLQRCSVAELSAPYIDPARLSLYSDEQYADPQFPYPRLDRTRPIEWVGGQWIDDGAAVQCPALPAYFDYHAPRGAQFCQVSSSGLAAGSSPDDAALRACLELLERDAFLLSWLARRPGRRVRVDEAIDPGVREVVRQLGERGARLELYLLDVGVAVPAVACVGFGDGVAWPGATVALSCHLDPVVAIEKAILEQGHVGPYVRRLMAAGEAVPEHPDGVRTLNDHALYYAPASRARAFDFLGAGGEVAARSLERATDVSLAGLVRRLRPSGLRIAVVDLTSPDLAGTPFHVVRALGPDIQPIHFGHRVARLGNPRLRALATHGINPDPHPVA